PVANFVADQTNVTPGTTVSFTDQSTGVPTSWAWSISPATGWAYTGGTTASSQNPQVTFNTVGQYSVTLTATNAQGSDAEVKTNYIIVAQVTGPCNPSVTSACDEFIQNVTLNTINNSTACTTGGYASYTTTNTSLAKGSSYTITVTPAIGTNIGQAYTDDEIAVWIDYNNDFTFSAVERIGYVLVAAGWSNQFNFTVPTNAITGAVRMRVRISFSDATQGGAPIDPCAIATYGETEDYTINIIASGGAGVDDSALSYVNVYPNPTENEVTVDLTAATENVSKITLLDVTGKEVKSLVVTENSITKFDISNLASGLYQVVIAGSESTLTRRIIKK
ncbi:MAG: T9SS C-terminal target domain-containing protein, partial [Flavobacteriales bacterium]|nr:T9SS C-terminal target domain-containing protein [Flavobacteriales bacterium]